MSESRTPSRVKPPGRFQRAVYGTTKRLEGHTLALGLVVAAIGALLALIAWASVSGVPLQDRYTLKARFSGDDPIVTRGDAVRIAGQLAGLVTEVEPGRGAREVTMELRPGFAPVGRDARAVVRVRSIVYLTYVELHPGDTDRPMPEGGTIPLRHSGSNVDLLEVVELFDRKTRETLSRAIFNAGVGLAGRGGELNPALADLPPITRHGTSQLRALTREPGALARVVRGAAGTFRGLRGERADDVAALISSASTVVGTVAGRSAELGRSIDLLRPFEDEFLATAPLLDPLLDDAAGLSQTLAPVIGKLDVALPDLNRTLALGDELRAETHRLTSFLRPVLRAAAPVLRELEPTVASIDPLLRPLRAFNATFEPYAADVSAAAEGILSATSTPYAEGRTAPGAIALRFAPVFTAYRCRVPYPQPGEWRAHRCP